MRHGGGFTPYAKMLCIQKLIRRNLTVSNLEQKLFHAGYRFVLDEEHA